MKTKLLKTVRRDKRFIIEHKYYKAGFEHSGWWYLTDTRLHKMVRHKRIKNIVYEYYKINQMRQKIKWVFRGLMLLILCIVLNSLFGCAKQNVKPQGTGTHIIQFNIESTTTDIKVLVTSEEGETIIRNDSVGELSPGFYFDQKIGRQYFISVISKNGSNNLIIKKSGYNIYNSEFKTENKFIIKN